MERKALAEASKTNDEEVISDETKQIKQSIHQLQSAQTVEELDSILKSMYRGAYPDNFKALEEASLPVLKKYNNKLYAEKIAAMGRSVDQEERLSEAALAKQNRTQNEKEIEDLRMRLKNLEKTQNKLQSQLSHQKEIQGSIEAQQDSDRMHHIMEKEQISQQIRELESSSRRQYGP
jgi:tRNA nucleotidyltransferase/poly(A) polymerase